MPFSNRNVFERLSNPFGPVRLVYFPPEIKGNRLCGNYTTVPSNATTPVTVETFGTTFTSGTAYISFENLAAVDLCGIPTGTEMKNLFLPLPSSEVSSMCGANNGVFITGPTSTSLNFADLQTPIASDVYKCQPKCIWGYPTQVKQLQPEWSQCWFRADEYFRYQYGQEYYLFDPPLALTQANSEDRVTVPNAPTPAPPTPAPAVGEHSSAVPKTTAPKTTVQATTDPTATSPAEDPPSPTKDPNTSPPQPDKSNTQPIEQPLPVIDPSNTAPANDPFPPSQSNAPAKITSADQPSDALGVFSNALSTAPGHDTNTAGPKPAQAAPSGHSDDPVSAAADASQAQGLVVGGSVTIPISHGQVTSINIPEADPVAVSRQGSAYVVAGQTLTPGQAATVQGQAISVILPQSAGAAPAVTIAPEPLDVSRKGSSYLVNGETITPGQVATAGGHVISLDPEANSLVVGSSTLSLQLGASTAVPPPEATPGMGVSRSGSVYIVDGTALAPGQSAIVNGQTMSEDSAGQRLFVGTESVSLDDGAATTLAVKPATPSELAISRSGSVIIVDGTTLSPGAVSVVDGQTVSALPNGGGVLVGSQTVSLGNGAATSITPTPLDPARLTISRSGSSVVVDGVTLTPGEITIVDGQTVSVISNGEGVVVGSRIIALSAGEATTAMISGSLSAEGLVTIGSKTFTAHGVPGRDDQVIIDGKTLTRGGLPLTTEGESLSLGSSGLVAIAHGHTSTVALTGSAVTTTTSPGPTTAIRVTSQPVSATTTSEGHRQESRWVLRASLMCLVAVCATLFA
ncbi:hypothetical protein PRZ48_011233 [Zasmidium cellare]|uniref:Uncharacterized protein n=1 Tax=Zasmidium cellare TaxID=395010 RepID=A0ABR0EAT1_ZASCE|nr:hypothetical protein PRZ48_011233 [Zasmidium cellare]